MSIIIHHNEPQLDPEQIAALRKFYACDHLITDWNFEDIPEKTLALFRLEPHLICHLEQQPQGRRMISINTAFSEMASCITSIIDECEPGSDEFKEKLREFLAHQRGEVFTLEDAIAFLQKNPHADETIAEIPLIAASLQQLGCTKEHMIVFTPPPAPQQIKQRFVSRDEIYT